MDVNIEVIKRYLYPNVTNQPPTCHHYRHQLHDPQPFAPSQIKLSKTAGINRRTGDLQPTTAMTSIVHVLLFPTSFIDQGCETGSAYQQ